VNVLSQYSAAKSLPGFALDFDGFSFGGNCGRFGRGIVGKLERCRELERYATEIWWQQKAVTIFCHKDAVVCQESAIDNASGNLGLVPGSRNFGTGVTERGNGRVSAFSHSFFYLH
jgi:hypothetical protein